MGRPRKWQRGAHPSFGNGRGGSFKRGYLGVEVLVGSGIRVECSRVEGLGFMAHCWGLMT